MKPIGEQAFETVIETHLLNNGYTPVAGEGFDRERAVFPEIVLKISKNGVDVAKS